MHTLEPLPIDGYLDDIRAALRRNRAVIVSAAPGAGKTTRVPPALLDAGPAILLQPRRVAARALTRRIADERGWTVGREIGWQIRFERRASPDTRLLTVTEGILTTRLLHDPLLSEFATVIFDEFHERSIHADLGLALARQAWLARDDLRIVVMSATLDAARVAEFLGSCDVVHVPGTLHPCTVEYAPGERVPQAVRYVLPRTHGNVLAFLPGAGDIDRAQNELATLNAEGVEVLPLHGSLPADQQDRALAPSEGRRVILATNIAETSLTVPDVFAVVDTGYHKVARYDSARGIDTLTLERVSQDSADQRAGRAARLGPGLVRRLWDARQRLAPHREPEAARVDLAGPVLAVLAWGGDPLTFEWLEPPPSHRIDDAMRLLTRLGAVADGRITDLGRRMQRIPAHPRIARILIEGRAAPDVVAACARSSGDPRAAEQLRRITARAIDDAPAAEPDDERLHRALFAGYADRLARRRPDSADRVVLASGHGATLAHDVEPVPGDFMVALDVVGAERAGAAEARIRWASPVDAAWVTPTSTAVEHHFDASTGRVRAMRVERYDAIVLRGHPVPADPDVKSRLLAKAWREREPSDAVVRLCRRARFAGVELDLDALVDRAALAADGLAELDAAILAQVPFDVRRRLDADAPERLALPSGRSSALDYLEDGSVGASVKLQELFGLAESPRLGPNRVAVTFHLLAPNGRPVQTTRDLRSFWERTYPEVRRELRGRYPKHPWPENPWTAVPTHRTVRRTG